MTAFNAFQLAIATGALTLVVQRLRILLFEAALDGPAFVEALATALRGSQHQLARAVATACLPAWPARLALEWLRERSPEERSERAALEELHLGFRRELWRYQSAIATLGRIAGPVGTIGVILELSAGLRGGDGLLALQRGLPMQVSINRALLTFALGVATSSVCFYAVGLGKRRARALESDLARVAELLASVGTGPDDM